MTERKPPGVSFESWVEQQIGEAMRRGDFENLAGAGKPLPGAGETDEDDWWVRSFVRRETPDAEALLPPSMLLRKRIDRLPDTVRALHSERAVRAVVEEINTQVRESWRTETGPQLPIRLVNVDRVVAQWYADRSVAADTAAERPAVEQPSGRPRWWRRLRRRAD